MNSSPEEKPGAMVAHRGPGIVLTPSKEFQHAQITASAMQNPPSSFQLGKPPSSQAITTSLNLVHRWQPQCPEPTGAAMIGAFPHIAATVAAFQLFTFAEPDPKAWQALKAQGVNLDLVTDFAGPIVRTPVTFLPDDRFKLDSFGEIAFALAVHSEDAETLIDLVAWSAREPATFGTLSGTGILGLDSLMNPASYSGRPCCLYSSPLAWLQADCAGAVVLDYPAARKALADAPGPLTTDNLELAQSLIDAGTVPASKLMVPWAWRNAA